MRFMRSQYVQHNTFQLKPTFPVTERMKKEN